MKKQGVCDVHKYALNDITERTVSYCETCGAWICKSCKFNIKLRAIAIINRKKKR